ncbi:MAG: hypothetical protein RSE62_03490 [Citrobacter sp.]
MYTIRYNGMYINGKIGEDKCYVTDDTGRFYGHMFKSYRAAQIAITKARNAGVPESR